MPGLLDLLQHPDFLQLVELQRQLGQSPFNQAQPYQWGTAPGVQTGPYTQGQAQDPIMQLMQSRGGMQDPNYNWLQPTPQQQPTPPPPAPPGSSYLPAPAIRPDTATALPPLPQRNPRFKTIQDAIWDASVDSPILEDEVRKGHSPPMYQPEEFHTDKKRKARKAV